MKKIRKTGLVFLLFLIFGFCMVQPVKAAKKIKVKAPTEVTADYDKNFVNLSWKKVSKANGYVVYRYSQSTRKFVNMGKTRRTRYEMSGLSANTVYRFRVLAYRKVGKKYYKSPMSKPLRVKTHKEPVSGVSTIKKYLQTAIQPIGKAIYVWGGGWSVDGLGGSTEARSMGVSQRWVDFYNAQTKDYNFYTTQYQRHNGLDCSGYVGWTIYNIMNTRSGNNGYVMSAKNMAGNYASRGWGKYNKRGEIWDYYPGDIMSTACSDCGHVWIVIGECDDGSVVALHSSSNPGVQLSGTVNLDGDANSDAAKLAAQYMSKYYPEWYSKFPMKTRDIKYLTHFGQMRWDVSGKSIMTDPDGYQKMSAEEVLEDLLGPL